MFGLGIQEILILLVIGFMLTVPAVLVIVVIIMNRNKVKRTERDEE